jgi:chemotaxis protein histidine kinase CheA
VKHTVHRYGGSIRAESGLGKGIVFQIQLPLGRKIEPIVFDRAGETAAVSQSAGERK